ncbi:MAG: DNA polymerase III subunit alpha [Candidatus Omnitrophica bacterium]|nr:DNA polymerase III subunit alpha [Candidatus Omnitrophota bacterium]MDD5574063.1 DNA polymerase III subunit alpha [Candidatus Omnitrophota bacterium]
MSHSDFVHLHLHTQFSLLDGACRIKELIAKAIEFKMPAIAMTDHGNMFGAIDFYVEAQKQGIKPLIGCEVYIAQKGRFDRSESLSEGSNHFILLARDEEGFRNLSKLVSMGYIEGYYYRPRIDKEILAQYSRGLIGSSACLKGELACLITADRLNDAIKAADEFSCIFGKDNFYLELQENFIPEQTVVNQGLLKIAKELNLPVIATNDVHYLNKQSAQSHEALLCIQTQTTLDDPHRMRFQTQEFYFKSPQEMKELFAYCPEAIRNTIEIANRCNLVLEFGKPHLPQYTPPQGRTGEAYLRELCDQGLVRRYDNKITGEIRQRLEHELKTISQMGFVSYFLIVWDFINYAKGRGIPVGPGRGSAAGSLVSYLLGITELDPLRYKLLFERFLNPERVGLPDIDIDFCFERRQEVIDYVNQKYGKENVAQIITFGTMLARAVIRDVGRVMGVPYADVDKIAKLVPPELGITLEDALKTDELKSLYENNAEVRKLIDTAKDLEGLSRHASVHAAGVVIGDKPLDTYMPLCKLDEDQVTSGFSMKALEKIGLLKMDFLGLRTLTVIAEALKIIKRTKNIDIDIDAISLEDKKTFELLTAAQTIGVFQLESAGMRDLLRKLNPSFFEDLIALLALYRPGPIGSGMLDDFIQRKHGLKPIVYDHPKMEGILKDTYGIMVYQEQVMQIASALAGFSMAQADLLRRAMAKKIPEEMDKQRHLFLEGCVKNKIDKRIATKVFDLIDYFSGYGFNRSHSAAYALISYRTAYLKANYPVEFMTALLTSEKENTDKVVEYVREAGRMGITVLNPTVNESFSKFTVENETSIRFGLLAVKNVGKGAIDSIVEARQNSGAFASLEDLCQRVDLRLVNRKVIESLIKCGAMDAFKLKRSQMMSVLQECLDYSAKAHKDRSSGQLSFFDTDVSSDAGFKRFQVNVPEIKEWPELQLLSFEKDILGFYVSGHPLVRYEHLLERFSSRSISKLSELSDGQDVAIVGLINKIKITTTRQKAEKMAILRVEDLTGVLEVLVFPNTYKQVYRHLIANNVVLIKGRLSLREEMPKILAGDVMPIEESYRMISSISIDLAGLKENILQALKDKLSLSPGNTPVYLHMDAEKDKKLRILVARDLFVQPRPELFNDIEELIGAQRFQLTM